MTVGWSQRWARRAGIAFLVGLGLALGAWSFGVFTLPARPTARKVYESVGRAEGLPRPQRYGEVPVASGRPSSVVLSETQSGFSYHESGNPEEATRAFDRAVTRDLTVRSLPDPLRSRFWSFYGQDLLTVGRAADARRLLEAPYTERRDVELADLLGQADYQLGDLTGAEGWWRQALASDPGRDETWWRLGRLELQRGRPAEAAEALRRAVSLRPDAAGPVYNLGQAERLLGHAAEADRLNARAGLLRRQAGPPRGGMGAAPRMFP